MSNKVIDFIMKKLKKIGGNDTFQTMLIIAIGWIIIFIPLYISLFFWWFLNPVTFVERFLILISCLVVLGWIQVLLIIFGIGLTLIILDDWNY